jgi:hypothetical protein
MAMIDELETIDAQHKEQAYAGLARDYVERGDAWFALHAQVLSDVFAAVEVLNAAGYEHAGPFEWLDTAVGDAVDALGSRARRPERALDAFRDAIDDAMPADLALRFRNRLPDLDGLEALPAPTPDATISMVAGRLAGCNSLDEFVDMKRAAAASQWEEATRLLAAGNVRDAVMSIYGADLAAFEAWIFSAGAEPVETFTFTHAEMRWALAVAALEALPGIPDSVEEAVPLVRSRLAWSLGPREARTFAASLRSF